MIRRLIIRGLLAASTLLALTNGLAQAGGWAVVTLDDLPQSIMAGQAIDIGFTVRQHGRTLRDDLTPMIQFDRAEGQDAFTVTAQRVGGPGHYAAQVTFPSAGTWNWIVDTEQYGMISQDLPPITVMSAAPANPPTASLPFAIGLIGSIGAIGALVIWLRSHTRLVLIAAALAGLIGVIGFATTGSSVATAYCSTRPGRAGQRPVCRQRLRDVPYACGLQGCARLLDRRATAGLDERQPERRLSAPMAARSVGAQAGYRYADA